MKVIMTLAGKDYEKDEYAILYDGGTEVRPVEAAEAGAILVSAKTRESPLAEHEKQDIEASLLKSDSDSPTYDDTVCVAVKLHGEWWYLPAAYR